MNNVLAVDKFKTLKNKDFPWTDGNMHLDYLPHKNSTFFLGEPIIWFWDSLKEVPTWEWKKLLKVVHKSNYHRLTAKQEEGIGKNINNVKTPMGIFLNKRSRELEDKIYIFF